MARFIIDLIDYRTSQQQAPNLQTEIITDAIISAEAEMIRNGIVAVGDISNDASTFDIKSKSILRYYTFIECFGFYPERAQSYFNASAALLKSALNKGLRSSITPHAPYSVSPELFHLIFSSATGKDTIFSYHNQESTAEDLLFKTGLGDFINVFSHFGLPLNPLIPAGKNSLQTVLPFFPSENKMLLVHNATSGKTDLEVALKKNPETYFCTCPNANLYIESTLPEYSFWKDFHDRICIGTDSLASNSSLSILEEIKTIRSSFPSITLAELIQWATLNGARFLGLEKDMGSIEYGKTPGINLISTNSENQLDASSAVLKLF